VWCLVGKQTSVLELRSPSSEIGDSQIGHQKTTNGGGDEPDRHNGHRPHYSGSQWHSSPTRSRSEQSPELDHGVSHSFGPETYFVQYWTYKQERLMIMRFVIVLHWFYFFSCYKINNIQLWYIYLYSIIKPINLANWIVFQIPKLHNTTLMKINENPSVIEEWCLLGCYAVWLL
jgi:hypothetical protein